MLVLGRGESNKVFPAVSNALNDCGGSVTLSKRLLLKPTSVRAPVAVYNYLMALQAKLGSWFVCWLFGGVCPKKLT